MKTYCLLLNLALSISLVLFTGSCSEDDDPKGHTGIPESELPQRIQNYVHELLPGESYLLAEKIADEANRTYTYHLTYEEDTKLVFDEAGDWLEIYISDRALPPYLKKQYKDIFYKIEKDFQETVCRLTKASYGITFELKDGQLLAFPDNDATLIGLEQIGFEGNTDPEQILSVKMYSFIRTYFPEATVRNIVRPSSGSLATSEFSYKVWLDNSFVITYDMQGQWKNVISTEKKSLPTAFIQSFPEEVITFLQENYPSMNLISVEVITEPDTLQYYFKTDDIYSFGIGIDNPNKPITIPNLEIRSFARTHFNAETLCITFSSENKNLFVVSLQNGFNFAMNSAGEWLYVDGHGYPVDKMEKPVIPEEIITNTEKTYNTKITAIYKKTEEAEIYYELWGTNGSSYISRAGEITEGEPLSFSAYEKAYRYVRYHYPIEVHFTPVPNDRKGYTFQFSHGQEVHFDREGNFIGD
ncbi:PepSY-like domain-containing protein [Parabacteroides pacaensis]|uniref:PepSY-like domain-containing protein n=1 Tax=Parabacteroides pacaensis TaxID=2086575 RepID=UPI000D107C82|nr:PepSY-like domain-containing protein [Parabacteroides pacaensis]